MTDPQLHKALVKNAKLREIVDLYRNVNLDHDCGLEGYDDNCDECLAIRALLAYDAVEKSGTKGWRSND